MALPVDLGTIAAQNNQRQEGVLPQNQVAMFLGPNSQTRDPTMEALARAMEAEGRLPSEIYQSTGLFRNPINQSLTSYAPDYQTKLNPDLVDPGRVVREGGVPISRQNATLGDLLMNRGDLFKAYPEMAQVPVNFTNNRQELGRYSPSTNTMEISLNPEARNSFLSGYATSQNPHLIGTVLHEIQHYIQNREGDPQRGVNQGGSETTGARMYWDVARRVANELNAQNPPMYNEYAAYAPSYDTNDPVVNSYAKEAYKNYLASKGITAPATDFNFNPERSGISYNPEGIGMDIYGHLSGENQAEAVAKMYERSFPRFGPLSNVKAAQRVSPRITAESFDPNDISAFSDYPYDQQINRADVENMNLFRPTTGRVTAPNNLTPTTLPGFRPPELPYPTPDRQISGPNQMRAFESSQNQNRDGGSDRGGSSMSNAGSSNNSAVSGGNQGSLGGRGSFASSPRSGGAFSSSYNARERRGGRIG